MRLIADEDVDFPIITRLRSAGHTVESILEQWQGALDLEILARAVAEDIPLLTADLDYGDYIFRDHIPAPHAGVILYRLGQLLDNSQRADIILNVLSQNADQIAGHFVVVDQNRVRFRPLPTTP